jgi:hypothetical protein
VKNLRWVAICSLALAVTACTSWDKYAAGQGQKYSGSPLFTMYEEWGTPVSHTRLLGGGRFYQFRKPGTDCAASVWTNDLDVVLRLAVSGPSSCSAGW